jgi:hypothetical protein
VSIAQANTGAISVSYCALMEKASSGGQMYLNEELNFDTAADADVKRAFLGVPQKLALHAGTKLYKWTSSPLLGPHGITPWWLFVERRVLPDGTIADGFRKSEEYARRLDSSHREHVRIRVSVSEKFNNSMNDLLLVQLAAPVWAFAGRMNCRQNSSLGREHTCY